MHSSGNSDVHVSWLIANVDMLQLPNVNKTDISMNELTIGTNWRQTVGLDVELII